VNHSFTAKSCTSGANVAIPRKSTFHQTKRRLLIQNLKRGNSEISPEGTWSWPPAVCIGQVSQPAGAAVPRKPVFSHTFSSSSIAGATFRGLSGRTASDEMQCFSHSLHDDLAGHLRVNGAEIRIRSRLAEREGKLLVRIEHFGLERLWIVRADHRMGNIVSIRPRHALFPLAP